MLTGKVALVTGASRGIGCAVAKKLAGQGAFVIVNYHGSKAAAEAVVEDILNVGGRAVSYGCNVADHGAVKAMMAWVIENYKRIDILVNNAGITRDTLLMGMSEADFDAVMDTNLKGTFNCIKHVARPMIKQRSGRIINLSSVVGRMGNAGQANYAASKAGVIGLTMSAARELASRHITVNAVAPGFIQTDMTAVLSEDIKTSMCRMIPLGFMGEPEDIAEAVVFLASDEARYITGQTISVDGGMYMG